MTDEPEKKPKVTPRTVVLRWKGDESVFTNGIPNRNIHEADGLSDEQIKEAVEHGTHEKVS